MTVVSWSSLTFWSFLCHVSPGVVCRVFEGKPASTRPKPGAESGQSRLWPVSFSTASAQLTGWTSQHQLMQSLQAVHTHHHLSVFFNAKKPHHSRSFQVAPHSRLPQWETCLGPLGLMCEWDGLMVAPSWGCDYRQKDSSAGLLLRQERLTSPFFWPFQRLQQMV